MKRFIKNNQWGRRKTPLWKQFSVKTPGEPIVKTSLGVGVTRVRILKKSEIEELRQKGYTVESSEKSSLVSHAVLLTLYSKRKRGKNTPQHLL